MQILPASYITVEDLPLREPLLVAPDIGLLEMLNLFQESVTQIAFVSRNPQLSAACLHSAKRPMGQDKSEILGVVTLTDVLRKIIQVDVKDELEYYRRPSVYPPGYKSATLASRGVTLGGHPGGLFGGLGATSPGRPLQPLFFRNRQMLPRNSVAGGHDGGIKHRVRRNSEHASVVTSDDFSFGCSTGLAVVTDESTAAAHQQPHSHPQGYRPNNDDGTAPGGASVSPSGFNTPPTPGRDTVTIHIRSSLANSASHSSSPPVVGWSEDTPLTDGSGLGGDNGCGYTGEGGSDSATPTSAASYKRRYSSSKIVVSDFAVAGSAIATAQQDRHCASNASNASNDATAFIASLESYVQEDCSNHPKPATRTSSGEVIQPTGNGRSPTDSYL